MADSYRDGYVEVHDRIAEFNGKDEIEGELKARFPDGSLQGSYEIIQDWPSEVPVKDNQGNTTGYETRTGPLIIFTAYAYRTPDDQRPGIGTASEPVPGLTPYTRNSELMNAETSAWGRALAAIGIKIREGVASGNEVRARGGGGGRAPKMGFNVKPDGKSPQREMFERLLKKDLKLDADTAGRVVLMVGDTQNVGQISSLIDALMGKKDDGPDPQVVLSRLVDALPEWEAKQTDVPGEDADLPDPDKRDDGQTTLDE